MKIEKKVFFAMPVAIFFLFFFSFSAHAAVIHLTNGKVIEGKIVERDADHVRVDIKGVQLTYFSDEIDYIEGEKVPEGNLPVNPEALPLRGNTLQPAIPNESSASSLPQYDTSLLSQMDVQQMTKRQLILALIDLTGLRENLVTTFARIKKKIIPEKKAIFDKIIDIDEIVSQLVPIYGKYFTVNELRQLVTFYRSEAGQKLIRVTPNILQDTMEASKMYFQKKMEGVQQ